MASGCIDEGAPFLSLNDFNNISTLLDCYYFYIIVHLFNEVFLFSILKKKT